jgi:NAD+ synthase (glutamine-hydrolysing)
VGVFPEQVIGGYAAEDLVQWARFVEAQHEGLLRFAEATRELDTVLAIGLTVGLSGDLFNAAALVHRGRVVALCPKEKLPTYNVFYEARTLSRGTPYLDVAAPLAAGVSAPLGDHVYAFDFGTLALEVCEDIWSPDGPMRRRSYSGAELVLNLSASPYRAGVVGTRREMIATRAADNQVTIVYANLVGANDGLVFDGGGFIHQNGRPVLEAPRFVEGVATAVVDLGRTARSRREATTWRSDLETFRREHRPVRTLVVEGPTPSRAALAYPCPAPGTTFFLPTTRVPERSPRAELLDDFFEVLALGVADYFKKTGAFVRFGVALSGGRDSLLTLLVAWRAVGLLHPTLSGEALRQKMADAVHAFYMPTRFSSGATHDAAKQIAADLGASFFSLPIEEAFERECEATRAMLARGEGEGPALTEITQQNVQARIRGTRMWNWSNTSRALFLQTGNMSEKSLGYTTIGGDLEGCFSVIANVPKTVVIALLDRLLERFGFEGIGARSAPRPAPSWRPTSRARPSSCRSRCSTPASTSTGPRSSRPTRWRSRCRASSPSATRPSSPASLASSPASSRSRSSSGCRRRSPSTWARSTSIVSAPCSSRWCSAPSGEPVVGQNLWAERTSEGPPCRHRSPLARPPSQRSSSSPPSRPWAARAVRPGSRLAQSRPAPQSRRGRAPRSRGPLRRARRRARS